MLSALVAQYQRPDSFSLTQDLPNEIILLTDQTTVTLSNIEISSQLFLVLLEKTRVTVGESFSITKHARNEDCIRENSMAINSPFCLGGYDAVSSLVLENIRRMPPSSIGCVLKEVTFTETGLINILPKLRINKDKVIEWLRLDTNEKEHVAIIHEQSQTFCVGGVEKMELTGYAVSILPELRIYEDCVVEKLLIAATGKEQIAPILDKEQPFYIGRVKKLNLEHYAVNILPKMRTHGDSMAEWLELYASEDESVARILEHNQSIYIGRVKTIWLENYAVSILPKLEIHEDNKIRRLMLRASEEKHVSAILAQDQTFFVRGVKIIWLEDYAVRTLTKLRIHEDNIMLYFLLFADGEQFSKILGEKDNSIELGRIISFGLRIPREIRRKLRYSLVDERGKEVAEKKYEEEESWLSEEKERSCQRMLFLE
ncbi:MAG: uncharacterized protein A8A55_1920 [Amphiamblys sp. WSBS2006]|nr:MAG: uncharacterized protein A8A55_1920 [Amphiamblys sp. WSBS2006]